MGKLVEIGDIPREVGTQFIVVDKDSCLFCTIIEVSGGLEVAISGGRSMSIECAVVVEGTILALPHAELRAKYKNTGSNIADWEVKVRESSPWRRFCDVNWHPENIYRHNPLPKTITIGDVEVKAPEREELERGTSYFVPRFNDNTGYCIINWNFDNVDSQYLASGLVHLCKEDAIAHKEAIVKLNLGGNSG